MPTAEPACTRIAIIGGGFTGAAAAFHLARRAAPGLQITVYDPRPLGVGLAYGTDDPAHRLNARAQRMSMIPDAPAHFCDWILATNACHDDPDAVLPDGRIFPRRAVYGRYVAAQLAPYLAAGAIRHIPARVDRLTRDNETWHLTAAGQPPATADIVILATGHAPPEPPARLAAALAGHPKFIADPTVKNATAGIAPQDRVLIVGTGLTMADVVASLDRRGHTGPITAISRRGQAPRSHAAIEAPPFGDFSSKNYTTCLHLLRDIRATLATAQQNGVRWQAVFDALRAQAQHIWRHLPEPEQNRLLRHLRPFWDVHRHRLPPQIAAALHRRMLDGTLHIRAASITEAAIIDETITIALRPRGATHPTAETFDAVIITTGPAPTTHHNPNPLLDHLTKTGQITPHKSGQGVTCDSNSRAPATQTLLIAGPLARGHFGELMSVPEIALQLDALADAVVGISK
jgi:uncharacterized NAD(P)/FAD-binding protein YdhS